MKKNFVTLRGYLINKYPQLERSVRGENYPVAYPLQILATTVGLLQTFSMVFVFFGDKIFSSMGMQQPPSWYESITKNKLAFIGSTMLLNSLVQNSVQSGAFEIFYNGKPVYSKLESGKMPTIDQIINGLERAGMLSI